MKQLHVSPHDIHDVKARNFSEDELLKLQELFIAYGFHTIQVDSFEKGHALLDVFLKTHAKYHQCAILSDLILHTPYPVNQIYFDDAFKQAVDHQDMLEDYLLNVLYVDFLAIECTPTLRAYSWYAQFEQLVHDLNLANSLTIVKLLYV